MDSIIVSVRTWPDGLVFQDRELETITGRIEEIRANGFKENGHPVDNATIFDRSGTLLGERYRLDGVDYLAERMNEGELVDRIGRVYHVGLKDRIPSPHLLHGAVTYAQFEGQNSLERRQGIRTGIEASEGLTGAGNAYRAEIEDLIKDLAALLRLLSQVG